MFTKGQQIQAKLVEEIEKNQWIVSYQGRLIKVMNTTDIIFRQNRFLKLQVTKSFPLELKVLVRERTQRGGLSLLA